MANFDIDLTNGIHHVFFIGIGGVSMSGLAEILHKRGFRVSGSDRSPSDTMNHLKSLGIQVHLGHRAGNLTGEEDLIVHTAAVKEDNPEMIRGRQLDIPIIDRACLLGKIMGDYSHPVSIAGTHGKTTTTSMVSCMLLQGGLDPTVSVGGILPAIGGNFRMGQSGYFVVESCEYFDSFLQFHPLVGIILNVEEDHLDYFKDIAHIRHSFHRFAMNIPENGLLIIHRDIEGLEEITTGVRCRVVTFGGDDACWTATETVYDEMGRAGFTARKNGSVYAHIQLAVPGKHNVDNALAAAACGDFLNMSPQGVATGLNSYTGVGRRFEYKGKVHGVTVVDDYAHHPTEIKTTLAAAKKMGHSEGLGHNKVYCVFQPHTYTRTHALFQDFTEAFGDADVIIVVDIFSAREKDTGLVHARDLAGALREKGKEAVYISDNKDVEKFLLANCIPNDLLITMGAGDVYLIGESLLKG